MKRIAAILTSIIASCIFAQNQLPSQSAADFDVIIKGGLVYDGTGGEPQHVDIAIRGDRIVGIGDFAAAHANTIVDANGLAVAPGFINMLSWSTESLIEDGRSQSEIRQGVTTEIMGEGESMGPVNDRIREHMMSEQKDIHYEIKWNTLAEYLHYLEARGVSCNVASFIGATTIREYVIGFEDKAPTAQQLDQMRELVRKEMEAGALGIGTSLIYPPAFYAKTDELIELCKVAAKYQGKYISHMRSEGNRLLEALDELIRISREAGIPAEVYHIKAAGQQNWSKIDKLLSRIEGARKEGLENHRQHVHLHRRRNGARRLFTTVDRRRRLSRVVQATARSGHARENRSAGQNAHRRMGKSLSRRRFARSHSAGRLQIGQTQTADRQIARRSGKDARQRSGRNDHGIDRGRRVAHRHDLFPDVGGEYQKRN